MGPFCRGAPLTPPLISKHFIVAISLISFYTPVFSTLVAAERITKTTYAASLTLGEPVDVHHNTNSGSMRQNLKTLKVESEIPVVAASFAAGEMVSDFLQPGAVSSVDAKLHAEGPVLVSTGEGWRATLKFLSAKNLPGMIVILVSVFIVALVMRISFSAPAKSDGKSQVVRRRVSWDPSLDQCHYKLSLAPGSPRRWPVELARQRSWPTGQPGSMFMARGFQPSYKSVAVGQPALQHRLPAPALCHSLVLPNTETRFLIDTASLLNLKADMLDVMGTKGTTLLQARVGEVSRFPGSRTLTIGSRRDNYDPCVWVVSPSLERRQGAALRHLEVYGKDDALFGTLEVISSTTSTLRCRGSSVMSIDVSSAEELQMTMCLQTNGCQLGSVTRSRSDAGDFLMILGRPGVDTVLITSCVLSLILLWPAGVGGSEQMSLGRSMPAAPLSAQLG